MKRIIALTLAVLFLCSCTSTFYVRKNQSHFDFPNSNVRPLGSATVTGEASKTKLMTPPTITSAMEREAYNDALGKVSGADLLLNIDYTWKVTMIPLYVITIYSGKLTVEGEPASMEVGEQKLQ